MTMETKRRTRIGRVVSEKMDKTVVVEVEWHQPHPLYKRIVRHRSKFKAHDEANACRQGDMVRIKETRPLSKEKRWRVVEIVAKEKAAALVSEEELETTS
ncbi:MAG: 30S ribosomal protein S17 [Chloroflexi bacterium]|nr:30S ribosomal protein S17 [Chloroflexota bacterium]